MFATIVVGVDGRQGGRDAIALAQALTTADSRMVLVQVYPAEQVPWRGAVQGYIEALHANALEQLERARGQAGVQADIVAMPDPSFARGLQRSAIEHDADLIILGSAHHGRVARLLLGDVGRGVLHGAPCAVAVAPRDYAIGGSHAIRRVAVGYENATEAMAALDIAAAWASEHGAALTAYSAWDVSAVMTTNMVYAVDVEALAADAERATTEALQRALSGRPGAESRIRRGSPAAVLDEASGEADLLVVGSRGWGPVGRIGMGSTSDHVVHHARCPVLVVPRPSDAGDVTDPRDAGSRRAR